MVCTSFPLKVNLITFGLKAVTSMSHEQHVWLAEKIEKHPPDYTRKKGNKNCDRGILPHGVYCLL